MRRLLIAIAIAGFVTACNGGSSTAPPFNTGVAVPTATPSPVPTPTPGPNSANGTLNTSTTASSTLSLGPLGPGDTGTAACPPTSVVSHLAVVFSLTAPAGTPAVQAMKRRPKTIGGTNIVPLGYFTVTPDVNVNCPNTPAFTMTFPTGATLPSAGSSYVAMFDPGNAPSGWNTISGPATTTGNTISWTTYSFPFTLVANRPYAFVLFTTSSTLAVATPTPTPTPTPSPTPTPTPTPSPTPLHLYVANDNPAADILQFNLPLTSSSTANFDMHAASNIVSLGLDANGDLAAGLLNGKINFFAAPLSGTSTPSATFANGAASNNGQLAFLNTGDFWAATVSNRTNRFNAPFSNASTPAAFVTDPGMVSDIGVAIDAAQNLYIANAGTGNAAACAGTATPAGGCGSNIYVYAPPYTGAPIVTPNVINFPFAGNSTAYRKLAVNATRLYATSVANPPGRVDVYNQPITAASTRRSRSRPA